MSFHRFAIISFFASLTILGCGNKIPVESPAGSTESASQASKASTDEASSNPDNDGAGKSSRGHHGGWGISVEALADSLGLSGDQVTALKELNESYAADVKALIASAKASGSRVGLRSRLQELREKYEDAFADVLTDEQLAGLEELKANAAARRKNRGWENYIAALADSLNLSDQQVADLHELYEDYLAHVKAVMDDARASGDRSELRTKLKALRQGFEEGFNDVLTDEQQTRLEEIKANAAARRKDNGWARRIAALTDALDLSVQQVSALDELYEGYQAGVKAAIDGARESGDRSELRDQLRELREGFEEDFNAVLTDEQKEKLEEMKSANRKRSGKGHGRKGRKG